MCRYIGTPILSRFDHGFRTWQQIGETIETAFSDARADFIG